jgi:hypothetical protein
MRGVPGTRGFFIGANLWSVPLLLGESLRPGGDLRRAWTAIGEAIPSAVELAKRTLGA